MSILYLLIPLSLLLLSLATAVFFWAVKSGQFDDLEGPAHRILFDEDENDPTPSRRRAEAQAEMASRDDPHASERGNDENDGPNQDTTPR